MRPVSHRPQQQLRGRRGFLGIAPESVGAQGIDEERDARSESDAACDERETINSHDRQLRSWRRSATPKPQMSPMTTLVWPAIATLYRGAIRRDCSGRKVGRDMPEPETEVSAAASAPGFEPDDGWVPADERRFGLDRRTLGPTLAVFALVFVMSVVLPVINATVPYHDIVRAGDVIETEGHVTFVPETGWGITSGLRAGHAPLSAQYPATAVVEHGALKFTFRTGPFQGDTQQLLDQIEATSEALNRGRGVRINGTPTTVTTTRVSRARRFTSRDPTRPA